MSYQVLSRICRPINFDQVIGQNAIVNSIRNSVINKRFAHAYLFTGTRGVGKTSMARIFAKTLRCTNLSKTGVACGECDGCIDLSENVSINLYEIDGASNNKVENIRDLIVDIQTLPSFGDKKIVIIDEVHMLSISAFNALLKTLEEPPEHVIFIFATTEPWKLPDTIISRCLRFDFLSLTSSDLKKYIIEISKRYNFEFENDKIAEKIAILGKGSVRDTLSLLDQIRTFSSDQMISDSVLAECLGIVKNDDIEKVLFYLLEGNLASFKKIYNEILQKNINHKNFVYEIVNKIYQLINLNENDDNIGLELTEYVEKELYLDELYFIYEILIQDMKWALESFDPFQSIEVVFQKICLRRELLGSDLSVGLKNTLKKKSKNITPVTVADPIIDKEKKLPESINKLGDWELFLKNLDLSDKNLSSKLEHLYLSYFEKKKGNLKVTLSYDQKSEIFFNFLEQDEEKIKLESYLISFFKSQTVLLEFIKKDITEISKNLSQIKDERKEKDLNNKKTSLLNNDIILKAEILFDAKVEKIKLKNNN